MAHRDEQRVKSVRFLAAFLTFWVLVGEAAVVGAAWIPLSDAVVRPIVVFVLEQFWWLVLIYMVPQIFETAERDSEDWKSFGADNGTAFLGIVLGLIVLNNQFFDGILNEVRQLVFRITIVHTFDFAVGVLVSLRIAFAGKERGY